MAHACELLDVTEHVSNQTIAEFQAAANRTQPAGPAGPVNDPGTAIYEPLSALPAKLGHPGRPFLDRAIGVAQPAGVVKKRAGKGSAVPKKINALQAVRAIARDLMKKNRGDVPPRFTMESGKYVVRSDAWDEFKAVVCEKYDVLPTVDKKNCFFVQRTFN